MHASRRSINILGICGSLRKKSYNHALLRAFAEELPQHTAFSLADLSSIPLFNADSEEPYPSAVHKLKEQINQADAVVISSPEYNLSYTAVLKNALEWLSRRPLGAQLAGKPVLLMAVSAISSSLSQSHLRDVMTALNMRLLNRPIIQVGNPREKFDDEGYLNDDATRDKLIQAGEALVEAAAEIMRAADEGRN